MLLSLARMRTRVRKPIGLLDEDDPDMTNTDIDEYLNASYMEIQDKFPFREKEKSGTFVTQIGVRNYEMPKPFEALKSLAIVDLITHEHKPLRYMTAEVYEGKYDEDDDAQGKPCAYVREDCFARLLPTPDDVYTIVIRRLVTLDDLVADADTIMIPPVWIEIVIYGAVWRAFIDLGDFARANAMKSHQVALMNTVVPTEQKEIVNVATAGLEVLGREY